MSDHATRRTLCAAFLAAAAAGCVKGGGALMKPAGVEEPAEEVEAGQARTYDLPVEDVRDLIASRLVDPNWALPMRLSVGSDPDEMTLDVPSLPAVCYLHLSEEDGGKTRVRIDCHSRHLFIGKRDTDVCERHRLDRLAELVSEARLARRSAPAPAAPAMGREELDTVVQAAVRGAMAARREEPAEAPAVVSDVDKPAYRLPERPGDFAVVVGIGEYSDLPEARFAERDAEAVKEHLLAAGFPSRNVVQLFGEKAGRSAVEKFVESWLPRNVGPDARVFFYFSGHGAPDPRTGEAYLLPWDADPGFLENTGYPVRRLYEKLGALKAREVVVAMDACFSGAGGRSVLPKGARPLVTSIASAPVPPKLTVLAAAAGDQITSTLEDQGHGAFTYYFLKGLSGAARDASGAVTAGSLYEYLKPKVEDAARRQNREQAPVLRGPGAAELARY